MAPRRPGWPRRPPADDQDQGGAAPIDAAPFALPYPEYVITQGLHGYSYGHMAIDLAAGKGATIYSPIHGEVTQLYTDSYGNPTLVIMNEIYQVTLLHGEYSVSPGTMVALGEPIGILRNYKLHYRLTVVQQRTVVMPVFTFTNHSGKLEWKCRSCSTINDIEATFCGEKHHNAVGADTQEN